MGAGPTPAPVIPALLRLVERVGAAKRLADTAYRLLIVVLDLRIDDECRPDELPLPRIQDRGREHHRDAGLLPLSRAGRHRGAALGRRRLIELDVRQVVPQPCLELL